jgi:hypothetical protein
MDDSPITRFPDGALNFFYPALTQPQFCRDFTDGILPVDGSFYQGEPS